MRDLAQGSLAEFLGTFALVFFGAGSVLVAQGVTGEAAGGLGTIAGGHGFTLLVFVAVTFRVSGAQFNPVVSLALVIAGMQSWTRAGAFIVAQLVAAAGGAAALVLLLGRDRVIDAEAGRELGATIGSLTREGDAAALFGFELIATFTLVFVILAIVTRTRAPTHAGALVGGTVAAMIFAIGPLTGASMNPARTLGPALFGFWDMFPVYLAAQVAGATLAALVQRFLWPSMETAETYAEETRETGD